MITFLEALISDEVDILQRELDQHAPHPLTTACAYKSVARFMLFDTGNCCLNVGITSQLRV